MVGRVEGSVILIPPCGNARPLGETARKESASSPRETKKTKNTPLKFEKMKKYLF